MITAALSALNNKRKQLFIFSLTVSSLGNAGTVWASIGITVCPSFK